MRHVPDWFALPSPLSWRRRRMFLVLLLCGLVNSASAQQVPDEYKVKAAFVFHFAQLVEWPPMSGSGQVITVCAFGDEPWLAQVITTLDGKPAGTRVLQIKTLTDEQNLESCNILLLGRAQAHRQPELLRAVRGMPTLTVGETESFLADGGIIRFHLSEDKVRFDINLASADVGHLRISSKLLLLATRVTRPTKGPR